MTSKMNISYNYADKYNAYLDRAVENIISEVSDKPAIMSNIMRAFIRNEIKTFMNSVEILFSQMRIDTLNNTLNSTLNNTINNSNINYNDIVITKQKYYNTYKNISIPSNEVFETIESNNDDIDNNGDIDNIGDIDESNNNINYEEIDFDNDNVSISSLTEYEFLAEPTKKNFDNDEFEDYEPEIEQNIKNISLDSSLLLQPEISSPPIKINKQRTKIPEKID